jgi:hypothetical protein
MLVDGFDRGGGADGHKNRRFDAAVVGRDHARSGATGRVGMFKFELHFSKKIPVTTSKVGWLFKKNTASKAPSATCGVFFFFFKKTLRWVIFEEKKARRNVGGESLFLILKKCNYLKIKKLRHRTVAVEFEYHTDHQRKPDER